MPFVKATSGQAFLKMGMYGPPGSGKTMTSLLIGEQLAALAGKRVAMIQTERSADFYAQRVKERVIHPDPFDFDVNHTKSMLDALNDIKTFDPSVHSVLIIDSISHLWDAAIAAYEGKRTRNDGIPMQAWGQIKRPYREMITRIMDLQAHVIVCGRQKNIFETNDAGDMAKVGVGMRAEGETEYEFHISVRMEPVYKVDGIEAGVRMVVEKDRTGILHGRTITNPNFKTFEPILPYLGGTQAISEDPDEVAARDSELISNEESKAKEKSTKSEGYYVEMNGKLSTASNLDALNGVALEIKKIKRYLTAEHEAALRLVYKNMFDKLASQQAPKDL